MVKECDIVVPGSKSYTHRILIASALADGTSRLANTLRSEDTLYTLRALQQMGVEIAASDAPEEAITVRGTGGRLEASRDPIYLGNSGTSMRLLTAVAALGRGTYLLTGTERMGERPMQDLLDGLAQIDIHARAAENNGCPPIEVSAEGIGGGHVDLRCTKSSQFLSALLLVAPYAEQGIDIAVTEGPVSRPYIDMTVGIMERLGVEVDRDGYERFTVRGRQSYKAGDYDVEPDHSQAGYFWAAAAVTGARIKVIGTSRDSRQGDVGLAKLLESMGCSVEQEKDGILVSGSSLSAIEADMADMPDMVPTLAVVAAFAKGTTVIRNVAHLKGKESDRLAAVTSELTKMGVGVRYDDRGLIVEGGNPAGAVIEPYSDHRIAMSFAVAGLIVPGVRVMDESCVEKSFPDFWRVLEKLYGA
jgi:3-phosphoshikimate 1-carboxyvinyltransferase